MKRFQSVVTGIGALALVAAFATPTLAKKSVIVDAELDEVTAAGQPKIAQAHAESGTATAVNFQINVFASHIDGQKNLTALTLNNIFGENQIANGVNVQSGNNNSGSQSNGATQSWGSAKAWDHESVSGQPGGPGGSCSALGLIAKCNAGAGGNAAAGKQALLWEFADEIAHTESEDGPATSVNFVVTIVAGAFGENSQTNLTALTVNNVFGFNQVANGTNVSSGAVGTGIGAATAGTATSQSNSAIQYRGAPLNWWQAPTFN